MTARRARAGHAEVTATIRDRISGGLKRIRAKMNRFAASSARIGGSLLALGGGVGSLFIAPIRSASRLQETMQKFDVVFGDNATSVKAWSDQFAGDIGRSNQQIAQFLASNQDLLVPMGLVPEAATEMSKKIAGLTVDLASFNDKSDADVHNDLQAALTGSGEVMKKYGVVLSEAAVKAELLEKGIDPKNATNAQKVYARMEIIMRGTTAAQGDAIRSGDSWANVQKRIAGEFDNAIAKIGTVFLPILSQYGNMVAELLVSAGQWIANNEDIVKGVAIAAGVVAGAGVVILSMSASATIASTAIGLVTGAATLAGGAVAVFSASLGIAGALISAIASPVGILTALVIAGGAAWLAYSEGGTNMLNGLTERLSSLLDWSKAVFGGIYTAIASGDWSLAGDIMWSALKVAWLTGTGSLQAVWIDFKFGFLSIFDSIFTGIQSTWRKVVNYFQNSTLDLIDKINSVSQAITGVNLISIDTDSVRSAISDDFEENQKQLADARLAREIERLTQIDRQKKLLDAEAEKRKLDGLLKTAKEQKRLADEAAENDLANLKRLAEAKRNEANKERDELANQEIDRSDRTKFDSAGFPIGQNPNNPTTNDVLNSVTGSAAGSLDLASLFDEAREEKLEQLAIDNLEANERAADAAEATSNKIDGIGGGTRITSG